MVHWRKPAFAFVLVVLVASLGGAFHWGSAAFRAMGN
jgi:hypothetical protein